MKFRHLLLYAMAATLCGIGTNVQAQFHGPEGTLLPPNPPRVTLDEHVRMQTILDEAEQFAREQLPIGLIDLLPEGVELRDAAPARFDFVQGYLASRHISLRRDGRVHVEIVGPEGEQPVPPELLAAVNTVPHTVWRHRTDAWVPINRLAELASLLPEGYFMERAHPYTHDSQGAQAVNTTTYINGGADGAGMTIAVMDFGYAGLTESRNAGTAPPLSQTTLINLAGGSFEDPDDGSHGTGCVEAAFNHAPGAHYRIYRTSGLTQFAAAVTDAVVNGADVISRSISQYNQGWDDNTGDACAAANTAAAAGLLFFTSAGNRAEQHWQGMMNPGPNDWHRFSGTDETIEIVLPDGRGGNFFLQWDTSGGTFDYDLYLYDEQFNILASSTNSGNTFEEFGYTNETGATQTVHLAVLRFSGGITEFELFMHGDSAGDSFQYIVSESSITSPSNSTHPNVISNAAVDWSDHTSPGGTDGIIQFYSSRGPSNNGATRPDIAGPTNTRTTCCGGSFGGTSSATPNNAGAATAFWSAYPQFNAEAIRWLMFEQANLWRDWGTPGKDNIYGHGGSILIDFVPDAEWLARSFGNAANAPTGPYFTFQAAYNAAVNNGHIHIFPGGSYPEPFMSSASKNVRVETVVFPAILGQP